VLLDRPLVSGPPADLAGEDAVLAQLRRAHRAFDLTTDLALIQAKGPSLATHHGVILAGSERWVTPELAGALRAFVSRGGTVLSLGTGSLRADVHVTGDRASNPGPPMATDIFGVHHGTLTTGGTSVLTDELGLFSANAPGAFPGFHSYEPITGIATADQLLAGAGGTENSLAVAAVRQGGGNVIEVGLAGFGARLSRDPEAAALLSSAYSLMTG
jgi:hypothetical protein